MLIQQHSKLTLLLLLLLACALPFLPSVLLYLIGVYRYRDTVFYGSLGIALFANLILLLLGGFSVVASLKNRSFLDLLLYLAFTLLSVVPVAVIIYVLVQVNLLINPG